MVDEKDIKDKNHVRFILNNLKEYVIHYEKQIGNLPEIEVENITFQLAEIDGFIIGKQKYSNSNIAMADIRIMYYWDYLEGKYDFASLMMKLKQYEGDM